MAKTATGGRGGRGTNLSWARRYVPEGYAETVLVLEGTTPLLMKSGEVDRDSEQFRAYELLGRKRGKSSEEKAQLRRLEWTLGLYLDDEIGPFIPGKNVKELLREAATKWRKGEEIKRSLTSVFYRLPLLYDGARDEKGLWEGRFYYDAMVANAGAGSGRVDRRRPMFEDWRLEVLLAYDPEELDHDLLALVVERSQKYGLGDYRPEFGGFRASLLDPDVYRAEFNGSAVKPRNKIEQLVHEQFVGRIRGGQR